MNEAYLMTFAINAIRVTLLLATPFLLTDLILGSIISLIQAATQVNEMTLTFVPKIAATIILLMLLGGWMLQQIIAFTANVIISLPNIVN
jgi:flagellar biosynthetic protein FliQ